MTHHDSSGLIRTHQDSAARPMRAHQDSDMGRARARARLMRERGCLDMRSIGQLEHDALVAHELVLLEKLLRGACHNQRRSAGSGTP